MEAEVVRPPGRSQEEAEVRRCGHHQMEGDLMTIRLPDSLANSNYKFDVNIPEPVFNAVHHDDGSISLSLCYNASEIEEFARNAARSMYENIENSIIKELLELNGYEEVVRCKDCKRCYEKRTKRNNQLMRFCMRMDGNEYQVNANDFCSYGTPKERGGEK